ncbi:MAG: hypothetical protein SFV81_04565 [Pirellulaceae bacterium]|nr:hypothetical protein [Pirellulaceae bacterium]
MSDGNEPHPLDDFEFGAATPINDSRTRAHKPLLRISVIVAALSFGAVFVFSLLGNNAPFNSTMQQVCYGVSNVSAMIMLAACCGILFAYRLPHLDPAQIRNGALAASGWMSNRFIVLVGVNIIGILMIWASVFFLSGLFGVYFAVPLGFALLCLTGLAATMAIIHRGYLRGYAVGTLAVLIMLINGNLPMMLMFGGGFGGGMGGVAGFSVGIAGMLTIAPLIGLVCAGYVALIERFTHETK